LQAEANDQSDRVFTSLILLRQVNRAIQDHNMTSGRCVCGCCLYPIQSVPVYLKNRATEAALDFDYHSGLTLK
jgi:hypothetical protein